MMPHIIDFNQIGDSAIGFISVAESQRKVPFEIKRVFWTYYTPQNVTRGRHAHYVTEQVLIAVAGTIKVSVEIPGAEKLEYLLDSPSKGLYLPPNAWHTMEYSHNAVQLALASTNYDESDYIRDYSDFKTLKP
ncbi:MAG TPA: FdtA/QdtA family cupin domain-containing protein [Flavobacteriales bacterium]|nr:dTDP-6-deoxy-3,4-keto-hexulose isomerase [Flavobacterium sp.]HRE73176.1 FdtA/QdtA family cupin domain-containing protein [Flavobacteriales bacterium]